MGLREKKKSQTKMKLRTVALDLFEINGYDATTVEQIAAAAEVSLSTAFRYFPTKEHLLFDDPFDEALKTAFQQQPLNLSLVQCLRNALRKTFANLPAEQQQFERRRHQLIARTPALQQYQMSDLAKSTDLIAGLIAERSGRSAESLEVRTLSGALAGVLIAASQLALQRPNANPLDLFDASLAQFESDPLLSK